MTEPRRLTNDEDRPRRGYRLTRSLLDLQFARDPMNDSGLSEADFDVLSTLSETDRHRLRLHELAAHVASVRRHRIHLLTKKELAALDTLSHRVIGRLVGAAR